ncbi:MAG: glycosyltransferase family 39 protein [Chloroflexi bacterium]|nr:glycosyltransferase family 39 protein [Chloroflexota bacterium]
MRRISAYSSAAILLLAFGLRVYHLDFQASLSDDALGLTLAQHNPLELFGLTASEPFPPTFYLGLSLWARLAGVSEYAGRFFSVVFSMGSVALIYRASRRMLDERAAVAAAFLLAINPLEIFFAQEVRMYTMLTCFSLAGATLGYELIAGRSRSWGGYALASLVAVMTHAFALFVLFSEDVAALICGPREWRWQRAWAAAQLSVVVVFGVWIALVARNLQAYNNGLVSAPSLPAALWRTLSAYALGFGPPAGPVLLLPVMLIALAAAGVALLLANRAVPSGVSLRTRQTAVATPLFLTSWLLAPIVLVWAISLAKPIYFERYMVIGLPAALLLAGAGIAGLEGGMRRAPAWSRWAGAALAAAGVLVLAVGSASHLRAYYNTAPYATRTDMRDLAAYVSSVPNAIVVTNVAAGDPLYGYYLPPSVPVASTQAMPDPPRTLANLAADHQVLWFLPFGGSTREGDAYAWLASNTYPAGSRWFGNAQVLAFGASGSSRLSPLSIRFGDAIELAGVAAPPTLKAGQPLDVLLRWRATSHPAANENVFVHLLNARGDTVAQHDGAPVAGTRPTSSWQAGDAIDDRHGLLTASTMPPGTYRLETGLYDASGKRLATPNGDSAIIATLTVTSPQEDR